MYPYAVEEEIALIKTVYPSAVVIEFLDDQEQNSDELIVIVARPLTMEEVGIAYAIGTRNPKQAEEWVVTTSTRLVWGTYSETDYDLTVLPVGMMEEIHTAVMNASTVMDIEPFLQEMNLFRSQSNGVMSEGAAFIMKAFPQYTLRNIKDLTRMEFAELLVLSEKIHNTPFTITTGGPVEDDETKNRKQLRGIAKIAKENSKLFDFAKDNAELEAHM